MFSSALHAGSRRSNRRQEWSFRPYQSRSLESDSATGAAVQLAKLSRTYQTTTACVLESLGLSAYQSCSLEHTSESYNRFERSHTTHELLRYLIRENRCQRRQLVGLQQVTKFCPTGQLAVNPMTPRSAPSRVTRPLEPVAQKASRALDRANEYPDSTVYVAMTDYDLRPRTTSWH